MSYRNTLIQKIHIAKRDLGMDDMSYRGFLKRETGKKSCTHMSEAELRKLLEAFAKQGWTPNVKGKFRPASPKPYVRKVYALWGQLKRDGIWREKERASLVNFVRDLVGCDDPDWLSEEQASRVIYALEAMQRRATKPQEGKKHGTSG